MSKYMNDRFYEWLVILRHLRLKRISEYESRHIKIFDKRKFVFTDNFLVIIENKKYQFEVRISGSEFLFYDKNNIEDDFRYSNSYYTISDIYNIINNVEANLKKKIIKIIKKGLCQEGYIEYSNEKFELSILKYNDISAKQTTYYQDQTINLRKFLLLISLIQEKSNSLFRLKVDFKNGLLNLLYILLSGNSDNPIINGKGWFYDHEDKSYKLNNKKVSFLSLKVSDENEDSVQMYLSELKRNIQLNDAISLFLNLYNNDKDKSLSIDEVLSNDFIKKNQKSTEIIGKTTIDKIILRDYEKGILQLEKTEDFRLAFSKEITLIAEDKYIFMILDMPVGFEYYLTDKEKRDIIQLGI